MCTRTSKLELAHAGGGAAGGTGSIGGGGGGGERAWPGDPFDEAGTGDVCLPVACAAFDAPTRERAPGFGGGEGAEPPSAGAALGSGRKLP